MLLNTVQVKKWSSLSWHCDANICDYKGTDNILMEPTIVVHGGAGDFSHLPGGPKVAAVENAVAKGSQILLDSGSAIDAVIAAVTSLEDDPCLNAGKGSVLNLRGEVEMDAIIMDGYSLNTGAVTGVKGIENPIKLAKLVMDKSPHVLLAGEGAVNFAQKEGVEIVPAYRFVTQKAIDALEKFLQQKESRKEDGGGTVGAVAIDKMGNVAAATSTGGVTGKYPGRIGDTPIPGSGGYADNAFGAVSSTGTGEGIMKVCLSKRILSLMEDGLSPQNAIEQSLKYMKDKVNATGGAVTVSKSGQIGIFFTTDHMPWAFRQGADEIQSGITSLPVLNK